MSASTPIEELVGVSDPVTRATIDADRASLFSFYTGALAGREGDADTMNAALQRALKSDPDNLYYRWFLGS